MTSSSLLLRLEIVLNLYFLALTLYNIRYLRVKSLSAMTVPPEGLMPRVSVILPVRNEETNIRRCLESLLHQDYENYEIVAINDNSEDGTLSILSRYAAADRRLIVVDGQPLEAGWTGKSFACRQGIEAASGELLLFTDADTVHEPDSVRWAVSSLRDHDADFISAYVRQRLGSLGELLLVPVIYIMTALLIPLGLIPRKNSSMLSFAIGQFMICRASAFESIGWYERFRGSVVEDIMMARELKRAGFKTMFLDAQSHVSCRMYDGFRSAFRGIGKSLYGAIGSSIVVLSVLLALIVVAIVYPFYCALNTVLAGAPLMSPATLPVALFSLTWLAKMGNRRLPIVAVILYPITFVFLIALGLYSAAKTGFGSGLDWKGRLVTARAGKADESGDNLVIVNFDPLYRFIADVVFLCTLFFVYLFSKTAYGLEIVGRENLRALRGKNVILVSNHVLYLDSAMVACAIFPYRTFFSALEATFSLPIIGRYIRMLGAFPLPEKNTLRRVEQPMSRMFSLRRSVHVFPEGELHRLSTELAPFKAGAFFLAFLHDAVVVPVTFCFVDRPVFRRVLPNALRVRIVIGDGLDSRDYALRFSRRAEAVRRLADDVRERMSSTMERERVGRMTAV